VLKKSSWYICTTSLSLSLSLYLLSLSLSLFVCVCVLMQSMCAAHQLIDASREDRFDFVFALQILCVLYP
jgi:hypothetical protein